MELREIETLLAIADTGSFSRAAERLGYSQSAVTMQMKALEAELGAHLLERLPRGARLTDEGRAFAFHAQEAVAALARARDATRPVAQDGDIAGTLRIGAVESVATALLPPLLVDFARSYPHVQVIVRTMSAMRAATYARAGEIDLILTVERALELQGFIRETLRDEKVVLVAAPALMERYRPANPEPLAPAEICRIPFVLTEQGESYRSELDRMLAEHGHLLAPIIETGNTETLVHLAERGVGASFLPRFSVEDALASERLAIIPSQLDPVVMHTQLLYHERKWLTPAMRAFQAFLRQGLAPRS